ncbi:hypothetical protein W02_03740 [Nitrospira sp. KM1]|nr:hypothetical protein W02_03740 [Nitrospira sp. KM1]
MMKYVSMDHARGLFSPESLSLRTIDVPSTKGAFFMAGIRPYCSKVKEREGYLGLGPQQ